MPVGAVRRPDLSDAAVRVPPHPHPRVMHYVTAGAYKVVFLAFLFEAYGTA
jgi:hypothetical protein